MRCSHHVSSSSEHDGHMRELYKCGFLRFRVRPKGSIFMKDFARNVHAVCFVRLLHLKRVNVRNMYQDTCQATSFDLT
jgi:hypothetical protein